MQLTQAAEQKTQRGDTGSFTGTAWQQPMAVGETPEPLHVTRVTFEPGARTVRFAAIGNALSTATGKRRRNLRLTSDSVMEVLR